MFDKFNIARKQNSKSAYAHLDYKINKHHERYKAFIHRMGKKLLCQECGGSGGWVEPVLDFGQGPTYPCGWCEGTGFVTPWMRGQWLKYKKNED